MKYEQTKRLEKLFKKKKNGKKNIYKRNKRDHD